LNNGHDGLRKAALMLSSLGEADRAWMLSHVGDAERARLDPLVAEARSLGFALDAGTLKDLIQPAAGAPGARSEAPPPAPAQTALEAADAGAVHDVLANEPDWLIAAVVQMRPWPWREALLRLLGTERRLRVQRARPRNAELRPRTAEALLAALEARLVERAPEPEAAEPVAPVRHANGVGVARKLWKGMTQWRR